MTKSDASIFIAEIFQEVIDSLPQDISDIANRAVQLAEGQMEIRPLEKQELHQAAKIHQIITCWFSIKQEVIDQLFSEKHYGSSPGKGWVDTVFTQHPNTPYPIWIQKAKQHLALYLEAYRDGASSIEELHGQCKIIIDEMIKRDFHDREESGAKVVINLKRFLELYARRLWNNAEKYRRSYSTWMLFDVDGQSPDSVQAEDILSGARLLRDQAIDLYLEGMQGLRESLSTIPENKRESAYCTKIINTLTATRRGLGAPNAYSRESEFVKELNQLRRGLTDPTARATVAQLILKFRVFGFTFLAPQPRVNAEAMQLFAEELYARKTGKLLPEDEEKRCQALEQLLTTGEPTLTTEDESFLSEPTVWLLKIFGGYAQTKQKNGRLSKIVIANYERLSDWLSTKLALASAGLRNVDPIPLFESEPGVSGAASLTAQIVQAKRALSEHSSEIVLMFGFSDTQRNLSCLGWWSIANAIQQCSQITAKLKVSQKISYGRASTFFRGGRRFDKFRASMPDRNPSCMVLVQGDDALRNRLTYQITDETRNRTWEPSSKEDPLFAEEYADLIVELYNRTTKRFTSLISDPQFDKFFGETTPIRYLRSVCRSVRPDTRAAGIGGGSKSRYPKWKELRAIGTVQAGFIAGQVIQLYGPGTELAALLSDRRQLERLQQLYATSPLFSFWLDCLAKEYERVDLESLQLLSLRAPGAKFIALFEADQRCGIEAFEKITGKTWLSHSDQWIAAKVIRKNLALLQQEFAIGLPPSGPFRDGYIEGCRAVLAVLNETG